MSRGTDSTTSSTRTFMTPPKPSKEPKPAKKLPASLSKRLPWLLVLVLFICSAFLFTQFQQARRKLQTSTPAVSKQQVSDVVARVGKLIILPTDETPTVITVKDASKLKSEKFYVDAKDGDKTLVYRQQQKAILYRPSTNIIVNVAPVTIESTTHPGG